MNEKTTERHTFTLLVEIASDTPPEARTLAETLERCLEAYPGINAAMVSAVHGDATHATAVLAHLFTMHKHKH